MSSCFYYNFGVFYPIFNFKPAFESQEYAASTRAYLTFVWSTPNIYILAYIYTLFLMFFSYFLANFQKFKNPKKSCLDISKTHLWLKFHEISTIFVTASGRERKMQAFLSQILMFFWNILANFRKFKNLKKSPLDISKTHLWLKFHEISTIFVTASGPQRKMYPFLSQILMFF